MGVLICPLAVFMLNFTWSRADKGGDSQFHFVYPKYDRSVILRIISLTLYGGGKFANNFKSTV
jgi:hypothetical protein